MKVAGKKHGHQLKKIYGYKLVVRGVERNTIHPFAGCGSEPSNYWKQQKSVEQRPKAFNGFKVFVESLTMFLWLVGIFLLSWWNFFALCLLFLVKSMNMLDGKCPCCYYCCIQRYSKASFSSSPPPLLLFFIPVFICVFISFLLFFVCPSKLSRSLPAVCQRHCSGVNVEWAAQTDQQQR